MYETCMVAELDMASYENGLSKGEVLMLSIIN